MRNLPNTQEIVRFNKEQYFVQQLSEIIVDIIGVTSIDRHLIQRMFKQALLDKLIGRGNLLDEYENIVLETAVEKLRKEFNIPENIQINEKFATHAKLHDIVEYLSNKYIPSVVK